jgi:hypothetical protein
MYRTSANRRRRTVKKDRRGILFCKKDPPHPLEKPSDYTLKQRAAQILWKFGCTLFVLTAENFLRWGAGEELFCKKVLPSII